MAVLLNTFCYGNRADLKFVLNRLEEAYVIIGISKSRRDM